MNVIRRAASRIARAVVRLAYPDYEQQRQRLRDTTRSVAQLEKRVRTQASGDQKALTSLRRLLAGQPTRDEWRSSMRDLERARTRMESLARVTQRSLRRGDARAEPTRNERRVLQRLERIAASGRPIVAGPWSGEVGFELLYWIPFLNWFRQQYHVGADRLIVVSRGGVDAWYGHVAARYTDALTRVSTDEFRAATEIAKKQRGVTAFDVALLRRVVSEERLGRVHLLHPESMYRLYWGFWKEDASVRRLDQYGAPALLGGDAGPDVPPDLPSEYVAVRFYFSQCFPDTPANRAFVSGVVETLAASTHVVLLNTPFTIDDHVDYAVPGHPRVHTIGCMSPERNLAVQTAVIRRARAFVGTYGGYSYLAPLCGVRSIAFYSDRTFSQQHLDVAQRAFRELGTASLIPLDVRDADLVSRLLQRGAAAAAAAPRPTGAEA